VHAHLCVPIYLSDWSVLQDLRADVQLVLQHLARIEVTERKAESKSVSSVNTDIWNITRTTASKITVHPMLLLACFACCARHLQDGN
jgi:hypothetical protein